MTSGRLFALCSVVVFALYTGTSGFAETPDADFLQTALHMELDHYDIGLIGQRKARSGQVKGLSKALADSAANAVDRLKKIARAKDVKVDETPDLRARAQYSDLEGMAGRDFDQALAHDAMIDTNIAVDEFTDEAEHGRDPELRAFAQAELAKLREYARMSAALGG